MSIEAKAVLCALQQWLAGGQLLWVSSWLVAGTDPLLGARGADGALHPAGI